MNWFDSDACVLDRDDTTSRRQSDTVGQWRQPVPVPHVVSPTVEPPATPSLDEIRTGLRESVEQAGENYQEMLAQAGRNFDWPLSDSSRRDDLTEEEIKRFFKATFGDRQS